MGTTRKGSEWRRIGVALALAIVLAATSQCGGRRSEQFRQQGDTYLRLEKPADAMIEYDRALSADPRNALAKLGVARVYAAQQRPDDAVTAYREAIKLDPVLVPAFVELAALSVKQGNTSEAEALARELQGRDPEKGGLLLAHVEQVTGRGEAAIATLTALREQFPRSLEARVALGGAYLQAGQAAKAEEEARAALNDLDPQALPARMMLIEAFRVQGKLSDLIAEIEEMIKRQEEVVAAAPGDAAAREALDNHKLALARALVESGRGEEGQHIAKPILAARPDSGWANYVQGVYLLQKASYAEALPYLLTAARAIPQNSAIMEALATAQSGGRQTAAKPGASENAVPEVSSSAATSWRELWQMGSLGRLVNGREKFLAEGGANLRETLVLSALFTGEKALAQQLVEGLPADSPLRGYMALLEERDFAKVRDALEAWKETDAERRLMREIARGFRLALHGAGMQALGAYSQCLHDFPQNAVPLYNLATYYIAAGMPEFAAGSLRRLVATHPANTEARRLLFSVLVRDNKLDEARELAESTYSLYPEDRDAMLNLAQAYLDSAQTDLALQVLRRGLEALPGDPALLLAKASALVQSGAYDEAHEILAGIKPPPELAGPVAAVGATLAATKNDWAEVTSWCERVSEPDRRTVNRLLLAAALLHQGNIQEAAVPLTLPEGAAQSQGVLFRIPLKALGKDAPCNDEEAALAQKLAAKPERLPQYLLGLAYREQRLFALAAATLEPLTAEVDGASPLLLLTADIIGKDQTEGDAAKRLGALADRYPKDPVPYLALADLYKTQGDADKEADAMKRALELAPDNAMTLLRKADFCERRNDMKEAESVYTRLLALRPDDASAKNNLAYTLLRTNGDAKRALELAQAAAQQFGMNPRVLHTLGLAQIRNGNLEEGRKNLIVALEQRPGDPSMLLDFGKLLMTEGRSEEGKSYVHLALVYADQLGINFDRRDEAEAIAGKP